MKVNLSATSWTRVFAMTILGTLFCILVSVLIDSYAFDTGQWRLGQEPLNNVLIPTVLAPPILFVLLWKMRDLALAHREVLAAASIDGLTQCLNRQAYTKIVEGYLSRVERQPQLARGALLVVDVDYFKAINDRFGHDAGDEALTLIGSAIRQSVHDVDLVARIGGEEFSVFLPGRDLAGASEISEAIRRNISAADFAPQGTAYPLSASVGGAVFRTVQSFKHLYRSADQQLYSAKAAGRNRVALIELEAA